MDFRLDSDDRQAIAAMRDAVGRAFGPRRLRDDGPDIGDWRDIGADGWLHAALPESCGGQDVPLYLVCCFAREAGRALCVDEWTNNAFLLPTLIAGARDAREREAWLERQRTRPGYLLADGRRPAPSLDGSMRATWCFGARAGYDAYALKPDGDGLALVRIAEAAIERTVLGPSVADVTVTGGDRSTAALALSPRDIEKIAARAALVHAATLVGLAEASVMMTVDYVKIREQFGQPVGRFQAVKHLLADAHVLTEVAWNACLYAALRPDERASLDVARLQAVEASLGATRSALQLHGGIGFTWESDLHLYLKLALLGAQRFGGRERRALAIGEALVSSQWT